MKYITTAALLAFAAPLYAQMGGQAQDPAQGFMMRFDQDKNGSVTLEEFKAPQVQAMEQQFSYMDKNGDGAVDEAEIQAFMDEMRQRMQQMQQQQGGGYQQR
jgi:Ca2+-binding EF-hand superfamily protein